MDTAIFAAAERSAPTRDPTVFIVDDDADIREAIAKLVRIAGLRHEVFASGNDFLSRYDTQMPGCLVLDIRMPGMSGLELQQALCQSGRRLPIIFITGFGDIPLITKAIRDGAIDVIPKPFDAETLLRRIHEAVERDLSDRQKQTQVDAIQHRLQCLTERESEVMRRLADGESAKQIAQKLAISSKTVDNHRAKVLEKMQVDNPTQLARHLAMLDDLSH
jgi:two-component system, LuxR family, response regulator FixJ